MADSTVPGMPKPPGAGKDGARQRTRPATTASAPRRPRRMLVISDAWHPQVNGVVRTYENLVREVESLGTEIRVIGPGDFPRRFAMPSYPEIELAVAPARRLGELIGTDRETAVHIAVEGPLGWAARRHCLRHGLAFTTAFHTDFPAYAALRTPAPLRPAVRRTAIALLRRFHAPAAAVFVATASLAATLRGWGFGQPFVELVRGVDTALFHPAPPRPARPRPVLLFVGRVAVEKNIEAFLALDLPADKMVVGDGPLLEVLRARHPDVRFPGVLTGAALAEAYRQADCFVFPSRTDTFGMVLVEAMASGLPIAAHDATGPRDIVTRPELGAIDEDLATAVRRALAAPGTPQDRHRAARERFCWPAVGRCFLDHAFGPNPP